MVVVPGNCPLYIRLLLGSMSRNVFPGKSFAATCMFALIS